MLAGGLLTHCPLSTWSLDGQNCESSWESIEGGQVKGEKDAESASGVPSVQLCCGRVEVCVRLEPRATLNKVTGVADGTWICVENRGGECEVRYV